MKKKRKNIESKFYIPLLLLFPSFLLHFPGRSPSSIQLPRGCLSGEGNGPPHGFRMGTSGPKSDLFLICQSRTAAPTAARCSAAPHMRSKNEIRQLSKDKSTTCQSQERAKHTFRHPGWLEVLHPSWPITLLCRSSPRSRMAKAITGALLCPTKKLLLNDQGCSSVLSSNRWKQWLPAAHIASASSA